MMDFFTQESTCATRGVGAFSRGEVLASADSQFCCWASLSVIGFHAMKEQNDIVPLGCDEKTKLRSAFQSASESYSKAVVQLSKSIGSVSLVHHNTLHRAAEQARRLSIEARDRLERHIAEHGCFIGGPHSINGGNGQSHSTARSKRA
jgi:hypothetical protein